jgi:hypothetical protein
MRWFVKLESLHVPLSCRFRHVCVLSSCHTVQSHTTARRKWVSALSPRLPVGSRAPGNPGGALRCLGSALGAYGMPLLDVNG